CFSFYPGKNLGAHGEAGALVTDDADLAARVRRLRNHAQPARHVHDELGFNMRMDGVQGAVLGLKLPHLASWTEARRAIAPRYSQAGAGLLGLEIPRERPGSESAWHIYALRADRRDDLRQHLSRLGVQTAVHYPTPVHLQPAYAHLGHARGAFPHAEAL